MNEVATETKVPLLVSSIQDGWKSFIEDENKKKGGYKPKNVWASGWRECTRRMVLDMVAYDQRPAWTTEQLANFRRGSDRERDLVNDLRRIGRNAPIPFEVIHEQQRFELKDQKGRVIISGKKDGDFQFADGTVASFEVKSWNVNVVAKISGFEDLQRSPWTKPASFQLLSYLYAEHQAIGFFILDRNGLPLPIPIEVEPNREKMESFIAKSIEAMDARQNYEAAIAYGDFTGADAALPPFIKNANECRRCPFFGSVCNPPTDFGKGAKVIDDPEMLVDIQTILEKEEAWSDYESAWKRVTTALRGVETAIAPNILIQGSWSPNTTYPVPKDVKAKYKHVEEKGKFTLEITKI